MRVINIIKVVFILSLLITGPLAAVPVSQSLREDTLVKPATEESAVKAKVHYIANDSMRFDIENQKVYLYGNAEVDYETTKLKAAYIELDLRSNIVFASGIKDSLGKDIGLPVFTDKDQTFHAQSMTYNFQTKRGRIVEVITKEADGYIHGETVKKDTSNVYYIRNGKYTTCDLPHPHFYIGAKKLKVIPKDKIITGPAYLVIGDVPLPLIVPFGLFPSAQGRHSGVLIPAYGESLNQGFFLQNGGYYFGISDYVDLALRGDIYSRGSYGWKILSSYNKRYEYTGDLSFRYSNMSVGDRDLPTTLISKDFFLTWHHNQDPRSHPDSRFTANVNAGSSSYNKYNTTNPAAYLTNTFISNIAYTKNWSLANFSANIGHSQNTITKTFDMTLPEATFTVNRFYPFKSRNAVGIKWFEKIGMSYSANAYNRISTFDSLLFNKSETLKRMQNGMTHSIPISANYTLFKYISFSPSASVNSNWYLQTVNEHWDAKKKEIVTDTVKGFKTGTDFNVAATASTRIYGTYLFKSERIKAIRHVLTPSIGFSWRPDFSENQWGYFKSVQYDTLGNSRKYSIFGDKPGPLMGKSSVLNFSLNNNLEMKVHSAKDTSGMDKKISIFDALSVASSYNMAVQRFKWSPVSISARTRLFGKVDLLMGGTLDPYSLDATGQRVDSLEWNRNHTIGRFTAGNIGFTTSLRTDKNKKKTSSRGPQSEVDYINSHPNAYVDFTVPWDLNLSYNLQYSRTGLVSSETVTQTFGMSGNVNVTSKWKIGFTSGYDFVNQKLSYTTLNVYRDLHCWDMSILWIPFGPRQSYTLDIKVKSAVLQDLKLHRIREWYDYQQN